jgi:hypothetical protein
MNKNHEKNKRVQLLLLLALAILVPFAANTVDAAGLRLIYANDNLGELDGCG